MRHVQIQHDQPERLGLVLDNPQGLKAITRGFQDQPRLQFGQHFDKNALNVGQEANLIISQQDHLSLVHQHPGRL